MANRVRISGGNIDGDDNEGRDAQVDAWGNLRTREGVFQGSYKTYEDSVSGSGDFNTHDFATDSGRTHSVEGWLVNDGNSSDNATGTIVISYSQSTNPLSFGDTYTVKSGEIVDFLRLDIARIKVLRGDADSSYRIFMI